MPVVDIKEEKDRFALPDTADPSGISARCNQGVLEVVIPKRESVQPRRIEVRS